MEGQHFAAGPWFTVQQTGSDWETIDTVWLSDGAEQTRVQVQIRMRLAQPSAGETAAHDARPVTGVEL